MPKIYRMMKADGGRPMIGSMPMTLGVRLPGGRFMADVHPDDSGHLDPRCEGMSVNPTVSDVIAHVPDHRKPLRFRQTAPDVAGVRRARARGAIGGAESETTFVWSMGEGLFAPGQCATDLRLYVNHGRTPGTPPTHGVVEPDRRMHVTTYCAALEATRDRWHVDEG